jgi:hypothetical protein
MARGSGFWSFKARGREVVSMVGRCSTETTCGSIEMAPCSIWGEGGGGEGEGGGGEGEGEEALASEGDGIEGGEMSPKTGSEMG